VLRHVRVPHAALACLALTTAPAAAAAQQPRGDDGAPPAGWRPTVFAYALTRAGGRTLDPFGATGRREVLQFLVMGRPEEGRVARVRMDGGAGGDRILREEGWYEIRGDTITLTFPGPEGEPRTEHGRYRGTHLCFTDPETGEPLRYEVLVPAGGPRPPPAASNEPGREC